MKGRARAIGLVMLGTLTLGVTRGARAADAPAPATEGASVVRVYVTGPPHALERLRVTVSELCARLGLWAIVEQGPPGESAGPSAPRPFAVAIVDFTSSSPHVAVTDGETRREIERRTLPRTSSLELSIEEASHIVYMVVESSLRSRERRRGAASPAEPVSTADDAHASAPASPVMEPKEADEASRSSAATADSRETKAEDEDDRDDARPAPTLPDGAKEERTHSGSSSFEAEISAFGSAVAFGGTHVLPGIGAALDAGVRHGAVRLSASLGAGSSLPGTVTVGAESATLRADSARLLFAAEWDATTLVAAFAGMGGGADRVALRTIGPPTGVWAAGSEPRIDPVLEGIAGVKVRISGGSRVFAGVGIDVDAMPHRYVVEEDGVSRPFFEPARIRPRALLGLSFSIAGSRTKSGGDLEP